ncbi:MAG: CdaR family protein [Fidelibacterota bacterium]
MAKGSVFSKISQSFINWFLKDTKIKIGILLFVVVIWFIIVLGNEYSYTISTPLEVVNIEEGKTLKEKIPSRVQANFSGRGIDLFYLLITRKYAFKFVIDVESIRWYYMYNLNDYFSNNAEKIVIPRNVNVTFNHIVYPESLRIELDRLDMLRVPVRLRTDIKTAPGYTTVKEPSVSPDSVLLSGPRTYMKKYKEVFTESLKLTDVMGPIETDLQLEIPVHENIQSNVYKVHFIQLIEQIGEQPISNIPVRLVGVPSHTNVELSPSEISLTVSAAVSQLAKIQPADINVYFNFRENWKYDENYYVPSVELPEGVLSWSNMTPRRIEVRVIRNR